MSLVESVFESLLPEPVRVSRTAWLGRAAALVVFTGWSLWILRNTHVRDGNLGSGFLHLVLLPFHEAGHVLFRPFGQFMTILGGSLGQLLMPMVAGGALLLQRRDAFGAGLCLWLLGFSTVDMAVYMYDAFDPKLVLLNGRTGAESDMHDWQNLFGDMGVLHYARGIGRFFGFVGGLTMLAGLLWASVVLLLQRRQVEDGLGG
jgi:hypothetical protein